MARFPDFRPELGAAVVIEEGETLFVPCNWAHHVTCLDDSISLTYNFLPRPHFARVRCATLKRGLASLKESSVADLRLLARVALKVSRGRG
jgi:hypothetical protein